MPSLQVTRFLGFAIPSRQDRSGRRCTRWPGLLLSLAWLVSTSVPPASAQLFGDFSDPEAPCYSEDGITVECSGDWSEGVAIHNPASRTKFERLHLSATEIIKPAEEVNGVFLLITDSFSLITDPSGVDIETHGRLANTIEVWDYSSSSSVNVVLTHYGRLSTNGFQAHGFYINGERGAPGTDKHYSVWHQGDIETIGDQSIGIWLKSYLSSSTIFHVGNIVGTGDDSRGIFIETWFGTDTMTIENLGHIAVAGPYGIVGQQKSGHDVHIEQYGNITASQRGISAEIWSTRDAVVGNVDVTMHGDITISGDPASSQETGIWADSGPGGDVNVTYKGTITNLNNATSGEGIWAATTDGEISLDITGAIYFSGRRGVYAKSNNGDIDIDFNGTIRSDSNIAIAMIMDAGLGTLNLGAGAYDESGNWIDNVEIQGTNNALFLNKGKGTAINLFGDVKISGANYDIWTRNGLGDVGTLLSNFGAFSHTADVYLESDKNIVINHENATFNSGASIQFSTSGLTSAIEVIVGEAGLPIRLKTADDTGTETITLLNNTFYNYGNLSPGGIEDRILIEAHYDDSENLLFDEVRATGIQRTTITGNFIQQQSGSYTVTVNAAGESDLLEIVSGTARLHGGPVIVYARNGYDFDNPYTILTSEADRVGQDAFDRVYDTAFVNHELRYQDGGSGFRVELLSERLFGPCDIANSVNQRAIGCGIAEPLFDDVETLSTNHDLAQIILQLETIDDVHDAYDMLTGEVYASLAGIALQHSRQRRSLLLQRAGQAQKLANDLALRLTPVAVHNGRGGIDGGSISSVYSARDARINGYAPPVDPLPATQVAPTANWWSSAYSGQLEHDSSSSEAVTAAATDSTTNGFLIGMDLSSGGFTLGLAGGHSTAETDIDARHSSTDTQTWTLAGYGLASFDALRISLGAMADWHDIETTRNVLISTFGEHLSASYDAITWQGFAEISVDLSDRLGHAIRPFAQLVHLQFESDDFREISQGDAQGNPVATSTALAIDENTESLTYVVVGLQLDVDLDSVSLSGRAGWHHAEGDIDPTIEMSPINWINSDSWVITGSPVIEDAFVAEVTISADFSNRLNLSTSLGGQLSDGGHAFGVSAKLSGRF